MRKTLIKTLASIALSGAIIASASTLGGLMPDKMGAEGATVDACDTNGVTAVQTSAWDATDKRYEVSSITLEGVADTCDGQTVRVTLTDAHGVSLTDASLVIPTSDAVDHALTFSSAASTDSVGSVHVNVS